MKQLRIILLSIMVASLFPAALLAQETTPADNIGLLEALAIVRETYGEENNILALAHDADNACWQFEFADGTTVCVDETTGEILLDSGADSGAVDDVDSGAVDDADEGALDNIDDGEVDNSDDGQVDNVDDGAVDNSDDGEVDDVNDEAVDDSDDGAVGNSADSG